MKVKLDPGAKMPTRAHASDAGLDLYSRQSKEIPPYGRTEYNSFKSEVYHIDNSATFDTGVHMEIPHGYYGKIESKSGLNVNCGVVCCGGVIDEGYTGSIAVKLYNFGTRPYMVNEGDKIAQIIIQPYVAPELEEVESLDRTERGDNGFGSTGK